jgi:hypothetical protein
MNVKQMYVCAGLSLLLVSSVPSHAMDRKAQIGLGGLAAVVIVGAAGWYFLKKSSGASTVDAKTGKTLAPNTVGTPPNTGSPRPGTPGSSPRPITDKSL